MKQLTFKSRGFKSIKTGLVPVFILLMPMWTGCTTIVTTKGLAPASDTLETTAVRGWNNPQNMRELGSMEIPVANLALPMPKKVEFDQNIVEDRNGDCPAGTVPYLATEKGQNISNKTIIASGYGAPPARLLSDGQKRLLALRAAKLDAIRTLAERVSGMHIWGGATISDMALRSDRVHVQLDTFIRGARMIAMNYMNDGSYEAVMEVNFNRSVLKRLKINRCVPAAQAVDMRVSSL
ncbi:MAG: hypothetical protein OEM38_01205 [Gammaproteobacteria bacterium]|nr:hypothetical protein [Gammaproteobacteria bacterium]